jgi:hypothetical protein
MCDFEANSEIYYDEAMLITIKNKFEGIHQYHGAPEEVSFLKHPHRHMFYVECEIEVFHNDRELEFIMVQRDLDKYLSTSSKLENSSCELIAREIKRYLKDKYPLPTELLYQSNRLRTHRRINVKVLEDNENGAYLKEV